MSFKKTIYKTDTKNRVRYLTIETVEAELIQISGVIGTSSPVEHRKTCTPKNVGKANETTGPEQAVSQAESLYTKKIREGYFDTIDDAKSGEVIRPMLAKDYFKEAHKLSKKNLLVQPKLDGIRCLVTYEPGKGASAKSRTGVTITTIGHILKEIESVCITLGKKCIFDGELYTHGNTFQENTKLVKNNYTEAEKPIEYVIYDLVDPTEKLTYFNRSMFLFNTFLINTGKYVKVIDSYGVEEEEDNKAQLEELYSSFIVDGYEGMMIRSFSSPYKINARSSDLLKYKKFQDIALPIVNITPNEANPLHGTVWVNYKGQDQKTGSKVDHIERENLLKNKHEYIGQIAEIRFFEETDEGKLRFAYYHGLRI